MNKNICFNCGKDTYNIYPLCLNCEPSIIDSQSSCIQCGIETSKFIKTCPQCLNEKKNFSNNYSFFPYTGLPKEILQQFKFKKDKTYAHFYSKLIIEYLKTNFNEPVIICPVPTSLLKRKIKNGYQLDCILKELKRNGIEVRNLLKKRYSKTQKKLNKNDRKSNLENSFVLKKDINEYNKIVLLDDVFTTGSTIEACAKVLGCKYGSIHSITLYRD